MHRKTFTLTAAAVALLTPLAACGAGNNDAGPAPNKTPGTATTSSSPTVAGTQTTASPTAGSSMSMGEDHAPIPANTKTLTAAQIYQQSRKGTFLVYGKDPEGNYHWGTAFIHDLDGEMAITNAHVVDGIQGLKTVFFNRTQEPVHVMGSDPCTDLAVIHISGALPEGSVRLPLGDSDALSPGDAVTAIGYPVNGQAQFRSAQAVPTTGIVQDPRVRVNIYADLPVYVGAIQHGAALQHGNSGGPLLDDKGNVVGINSLTGPTDTQGQYYSIPINAAHEETDKLMTGENVNSVGWTLTPHSINRLGAGVERSLHQAGYGGGLFVMSTEPGGPVDGRVQAGDLVTRLSNTPVNTLQDVCDIVESTLPGHVITADGLHVYSKPAYTPFHAQWRMPGTH